MADDSLTPDPGENIYSGVVSLEHLRLVIFLGELNNCELWGADTGNSYLEAYTHEKLFIIAGAEFEELGGFILVFNKAPYGSEFVAAKTAMEQNMDLRYTLKYLGVPINSKSHMVGDNRSIVTSATLPHST